MTKKKKNFNYKAEKNNILVFSFYDYLFIIIFFFALFYNQFVTLDKLSNITNPIAPFGSVMNFLNFLNRYGSRIFAPMDLYNLFFIIIPILYFIYREKKNHLISYYITTNRFTHKKIIFILFIISVVTLRYYFARGEELHWGDSSYFISMATSYYKSFKNFNFFPYFSYMLSCGNPYYVEYPPLFGYISGTLNFIFHNIYTSVKITLFLLHFFSALGTYLFIYEISRSKKIAFISAVANILLYFHGHISIYLGRYSSALGWTLFPFILYFFEKSIKTINFQNYLLLSLSIGLLFLSNIGMAYMFSLAIAVYVIVKFILLITNQDKHVVKKMFFFISAVIIGILIGSVYFYFVSELLKYRLYSGQSFSAGDTVKIIKNIIQSIFIWNNYKIRLFGINFSWQSSYWGISVILLSIVGGWHLSRARKNLELLLMWLFTWIIIIGFGWLPVFRLIPYFYNYSNARYMHLLAMTTIFLSGYSYDFFRSRLKNKNSIYLFLIVMMIIFIDLFPTTFQDTFGRFYGGTAYPVFKYLKDNYGYKNNTLAGFRVDQIGDGSYPYVNQNWRNMNSSVSEVAVPFVYDDSRVYIPLGIFGNKFYRAHIIPLMKKRVYIESLNFFKYYYMLNTRFLISSYPLKTDETFYKKVYKNRNIYFAEFKYHSPVFFSFRIKQFNPLKSENYDSYALLNKYSIDFKKNISDIIFVTNAGNIDIPRNTDFSFKITGYKVYEDKVLITIDVSSAIFAQLSYIAYPNTKVFLNKSEISYMKSPQGFIVVKLKKGINKIEIIPRREKFLNILMIISVIVFLLVIIFLLILLIRRIRK